MAKYYVTFSCGHDGEVRLFGPHRERQRPRKKNGSEKSDKRSGCRSWN